MPVDTGEGLPHAHAVALGNAVRDELDRERNQSWLAGQLGVDPSWVTRLVKGELPALTLAQVARIESVLNLPPGALFIAAGVVRPALTVEDAVRQDPRLRRTGKEAVLAMYRHFASATEGQ